MDDIKRKILISLFIVFMIFPIYVYAAKAVATKPVLSDEAQMCLGCHSNKGHDQDFGKQRDFILIC